MKKFYFFGILLLLFGFSSSVAKATGTTKDSTVLVPTQTQKFAATKRLEIKEKIMEVKASRSAALAVKKQENIEDYWGRLIKRIQSLIEKQEKLIERMNSRIEKIEAEEDRDLSEVKLTLTEAKKKLDLAKAELSAANDSLPDVLKSENPKEAFKAVRDTVYEIRKTIIEVHTSLAQTIGQLRGLKVGGE